MRRALALIVAAGCGQPAAEQAQTRAGSALPPVPPTTAALLGSMARLAGAVPDAAQLASWAQKIDADRTQLGAFIDELLANDRFASEVVPTLVFGSYVNVRNYYGVPAAFTLSAAQDGTLYLREPCSRNEAVTVRPWWALETEVRVCPDAYRPDKWTMTADEHSYRTRTVLTCDSQIGSPELETKSLCGCGPNLIRCLRDASQYDELTSSMMAEVKQTTAYIVQHDLPIASLFTTSSTFRDRNVETYYRRQKIGTLELKAVEQELANLRDWPDDGQWAARPEVVPGQHAGLLTAPQILHSNPDRRQRQRGYYELLWCNLRNSFGATTHKVLELNSTGNNFFSLDSWQKLAHQELCTNCHARLDYGFQFFMGYPDSRASTHYTPAQQASGEGPLYGADIDDLRGKAPLTPIGFAKLATEQPDFKSCMTSRVVDYVLADRATGADIEAIAAAIEQTGTFKPAMKAALERYAASWRTMQPALAATVAPATRTVSGGVVVSPALRAKLDEHCIECHDQTPFVDGADSDNRVFDFRGAELPRSLVVRMADQVSFGMMPKDGLDANLRDEVVRLLVASLWSEPSARAEAERYYLGRARALPAHQVDNAIHAIDSLAHARSNMVWGALERGIGPDQATLTPGFIALAGLEALRACVRASSAKADTLDGCLQRATSLDVLARQPSPVQ